LLSKLLDVMPDTYPCHRFWYHHVLMNPKSVVIYNFASALGLSNSFVVSI
jgi:hypothetical protein